MLRRKKSWLQQHWFLVLSFWTVSIRDFATHQSENMIPHIFCTNHPARLFVDGIFVTQFTRAYMRNEMKQWHCLTNPRIPVCLVYWTGPTYCQICWRWYFSDHWLKFQWNWYRLIIFYSLYALSVPLFALAAVLYIIVAASRVFCRWLLINGRRRRLERLFLWTSRNYSSSCHQTCYLLAQTACSLSSTASVHFSPAHHFRHLQTG